MRVAVAGGTRPRRIIRLPVLGEAARGVAGTALLPGADATLGTVTFDDWFTAPRP